MLTDAARSSSRNAVVGLLVLCAVAGLLPLLAIRAFWVDLDGDGGPDLTVPLVFIVQSGAAVLVACAVLRRRAMVPFYAVWTVTCFAVVATLLARPAGPFVNNLIFIVVTGLLVVVVGVGFWVVRAKGPTA
jgi:hypothetical protein